MTKYFKKFNTHEEYEAYITSESKILPNVSVCVINKHVHYNPRTKSVTGVTLNKSSLSLRQGASETLVATVLPNTASNKQVTWTSSNSNVASVDNTGKVTAVSGGNATITVTTVDGGFTAQCATSVAVVHEWVEIGGLKWATMNIGATSITDYGKYFQWGDTQGYTASQVGSGEGKKYFGWEDYKYCNGTSSVMTKYDGTDYTVLQPSDDAVQAAWGGEWRMPTEAEFQTLINACNTAWTSITVDNVTVNGRLFTDKTDPSKTLFFPTAGLCINGLNANVGSNGYYWSSSLSTLDVTYGCYLYLSNDRCYVDNFDRRDGFAVRGVIGSAPVSVTGITLNKSSLSLDQGASETLIATVLPTSATNKNVTWASSDSSVATVDSNGLVTAVGSGNATITVRTVDGNFTAQCSVGVIVHDYIEIGGVKWATMNIGATGVTDAGLYFQWGDAQGYTASQVGSGSGQKYFDWTDYKFNPSGDGETFTKYNNWNGQRVLEASDDAARTYWGSDWRMPTWDELTALRDSTDYAWVDNYQDSGVSGYLFTGKPNTSDEGKELFFPSVGRANRGSIMILNNGFYWGSSLFISSESLTKHNLNMASYFTFRSNGNYWGKAYRDFGFPVRGVHV